MTDTPHDPDAANRAEKALTERIVARLLRIAMAVGDTNPAFRDGLLLAAGEAKNERLFEPDPAPLLRCAFEPPCAECQRRTAEQQPPTTEGH